MRKTMQCNLHETGADSASQSPCGLQVHGHAVRRVVRKRIGRVWDHAIRAGDVMLLKDPEQFSSHARTRPFVVVEAEDDRNPSCPGGRRGPGRDTARKRQQRENERQAPLPALPAQASALARTRIVLRGQGSRQG